MAQGRLRGDTISSTKRLLRRTGVLLAMTMGVNVILSEATGFAQGRFQGDAISSTKRLLRRTGVLLAMTMGVNVIESYVVGKSLP
jgi:hypothetical protein